ncbi:MAG: HAMP domain-containing histidine kinase [Campylobacter sp.]|uniref:sensor histidine kinase n=1 Tax=Campylobacter sp. TaxID=205 RepID=UPI002AA615C0|nr:HAMP domain-containing sensor histidine kinase [Campylobacter sp.]MCI6579417.1 HAMP domain-containing histidine kinase [Campylobacter sp.]
MLAVGILALCLVFFAAILLRILGANDFLARSDEIVFYLLFISLVFSGALYFLLYNQSKKIAKIIYEKDKKLKKQASKISQQNARQQSLIEGICHEIKNPVAIMRLSAQSLQASTFAQKIIYSCDKITKLLDTLNSAFIGDIEPKIEKIDLAELALRVKNELADERIEISGQKCVFCDRELMGLLLYNLISNALKYSSGRVIIRLSKSGIFVRDFGEGFSKSEKELIFKKFYKGQNHKNSGSLGFGLWACKQICKIHSFLLKANSTKHGSTFGVLC